MLKCGMNIPEGPTEGGWWSENLIIAKDSSVYRWTSANGRLNVVEDKGDEVVAQLWCEPIYDDEVLAP
jgi:hypothetical protein